MNNANSSSAQTTVISVLCVCVLSCIFVAGLWPFHIERNAVSWLNDQDGLLFAGHGAAISAAAFTMSEGPNDMGFTLELCLTPAQTKGKGTFLAFDSSPDP